jgi:predicted enzyme related to lactoylglutathione lyase
MITRLIRVTILVRDQDEALAFYTEKLGFAKRADVSFGPGMRWLTVAPVGQADIEIVLQQPEPATHGMEKAGAMLEMVGRGTTWVFACDDCRATYHTLRERGVAFTSEPREEPYGVEAVFTDLYGNSFSLLQPYERERQGQPETSTAQPLTDAAITKADLIAARRAGQADLEVALAAVGEARMTEPGAAGHWSVKDVLAHIAVGDEWTADQIERATRGDPPPSAVEMRQMQADGFFDNEFRNTYYYNENKGRPLADVLAWQRTAREQLLNALEAAPDAVLAQPDWWTGGRPLAEVIPTTHDHEHAEGICAWLAHP